MPLDTDLPLKVLFRTRPQDLLALTGDAGARVLSAKVLELQSARRTVDFVLKLRGGSEVYLRHLEFQSRHRPEVLARAFGYNAQLLLQTRLPVVTTIVYLSPPAPREPAFTVRLRGREWNRWRFATLRLWEIDAAWALSLGPGAAALVPLMKDHDPALLARAARRIRALAPAREQPDLLAILRALGERVYTATQLETLVGREVLMQSSFWDVAMKEGLLKGIAAGRAKGHALGRAEGIAAGRAKGRTEGIAAGRAEGSLSTSRKLCAALARRDYPELSRRLLPMIERCTDVALLQKWVLRPQRMAEAAAAARPVTHRVPRAHRVARRATPKVRRGARRA